MQLEALQSPALFQTGAFLLDEVHCPKLTQESQNPDAKIQAAYFSKSARNHGMHCNTGDVVLLGPRSDGDDGDVAAKVVGFMPLYN